MTLIVLDLDGTITRCDNLVGFTKFMLKRKIRFWFAIPVLILLKFDFISNNCFKKLYARLILRGYSVNFIDSMAEQYVTHYLKRNNLNEKVMELLSEHAHSEKWIISANYSFLIKQFNCVIKTNHFSGIELQTANGIYTGRIEGIIPYGIEKVTAYNSLLQKSNKRDFIDLSIGVGDNNSDLSLLNRLNKGYLIRYSKNGKCDLFDVSSLSEKF